MGFLDFIFGKKKEESDKTTTHTTSSTRPTTAETAHVTAQPQRKSEIKSQLTMNHLY